MASTPAQYAYAAAWLRSVMAVMALMLAPWLGVQLGTVRAALLAYIVAALVEQVLIKHQIGGELRALVGGILDIAILTAVTHVFGSTGSPLLALYLLIPVLNALVATPRIAWTLALLGVVAYAALLVGEYSGLLAPPSTAPYWSTGRAPQTLAELMAPIAVLAPMILVATSVTVRLARAVTEREHALVAANARLAATSRKDALTQLFNRRHALERLEAELARVRRGHPMALLMLDLDGFKGVNDTHGHLAGDEVLRQVAAALHHSVRETDVVARYGGDEFIAILADATPDAASVAAQRLRAATAAAGTVDDEPAVTASIGIAIARADDDAAALIRRADDNTYRAKAQGRDRVVGP